MYEIEKGYDFDIEEDDGNLEILNVFENQFVLFDTDKRDRLLVVHKDKIVREIKLSRFDTKSCYLKYSNPLIFIYHENRIIDVSSSEILQSTSLPSSLPPPYGIKKSD